ncbi:MAG: hypothetical protein ABI165_12430 [Bryobacteraceae bacterium]
MKKIMSMMLGLSLVVGTASFAFAQDSTGTTKKTSKKKTHKKKGGDSTTTPTPK